MRSGVGASRSQPDTPNLMCSDVAAAASQHHAIWQPDATWQPDAIPPGAIRQPDAIWQPMRYDVVAPGCQPDA